MSLRGNRFRLLDFLEESDNISARSEPITSEPRSPRDTLFVSAADKESETIVSYSSGRLSETMKQSKLSGYDAKSSVSYAWDCIDFTELGDCFTGAQAIISCLLSGATPRCVRTIESLNRTNQLTDIVSSICIASNVIPISVTLIKKGESSNDLIFLIRRRSCLLDDIEAVPMNPVNYSDSSRFVVDLFSAIYVQHKGVSLTIGSDISQTLKAIGTVCSELPNDMPYIEARFEPTGEPEWTNGAIRAVISKITDPESISSILGKKWELEMGIKFMEHLPATSIIQMRMNSDITSATGIILRILLAGYCGVELAVDTPAMSCNCLWEVVLVIVKYVEIYFKIEKGSKLTIMRKSQTVDSLASRKKLPTSLEEFTDSSSLMSIGSCILTSLSKTQSSTVSLPKSVQLCTAIGSLLAQACEGSTLKLTSETTTLIMTVTATKSDLADMSSLLSSFAPPDPCPGDASPSNYKPVDATIRHGTDEELKQMRSKLENLKSRDSKRFSVLLVGPWNIGAGVRLIAESGSALEFISERAVRDAQGVQLKCAARLFVKRDDVDIDLPFLLNSCEIVQVAESDSRITIANRLFTCLNEAPNECPYVLIRAQGDYCAFIAAMSVIVANGWSRTIHQRVETRVVKHDSETLYYVTRLIVNSM